MGKRPLPNKFKVRVTRAFTKHYGSLYVTGSAFIVDDRLENERAVFKNDAKFTINFLEMVMPVGAVFEAHGPSNPNDGDGWVLTGNEIEFLLEEGFLRRVR